MFSANYLFKRGVQLSLKNFASTLAFIETANGKITPGSLSALAAAKQLNQPITALLVGESAAKVAKSELNKLDSGLFSKVIVSGDKRYNHYLPEEVTPLFHKVLADSDNDFKHFFVPASFVGKSILPRVASQLNVQPISDIVAVKDASTFRRLIYAGNAVATVKSKDSIILASVRTSAFEPLQLSEESKGEVSVEELAYVPTENTTEWVGENLIKSERPDLGSAKVVVSGGRGLGSKEKFDELIEPLAHSLNAAIGASRAAVDAGYVDNSLQVGQTGKIVAPDLYISVGISGAIQHLAGMKDSKVIVAINKAEDSPIFNVSDYGLVGDLFEIVPELTKKIQEAKK